MDGYAPAFVSHNVPLLFISGINPEIKNKAEARNDADITSHMLDVDPETAVTLMTLLKDGDASNADWNSREFVGRNRFRMKSVGRDYTLPPRAASSISVNKSSGLSSSRLAIHSSLSPLSPESSLYPDGLICSQWIEKHQELVPCALVSFYKFTSDPNISQIHDDNLKAAIRRERNILNQSGYKCYLVVALISDNATVISSEVEERLSSIRKETGLDTKKSLLFLSSQISTAELKGSVNNLITKIYPACIEYYRDQSKHSRRKKNKGSVPRPTILPTSGTSQVLSSQGWNFRYDFKLGIFAEFRQEMETALRSYEGAYENLLGTDIFGTIANWSPRWDEARCLADILAFRMIRCLLWNGYYTSAVRRWESHKERIKDIVDRRGKGSATYSWEAWQASWATIMAETITMASIPEFSGPAIYLLPEKSIANGGRIRPFEHLHHPGYWFHAASKHLISRRILAQNIPDEDRSAPILSSGKKNLNPGFVYDTYMCPEPYNEYPLPGQPGVDHSTLIINMLAKAITEFEQRKQIRLVLELKLLSSKELIQKNLWDEAFRLLLSIQKGMLYRTECWWSAVEETLLALRKAAVQVGDAKSILAVDWELMNKEFTYYSNSAYDYSKALNDIDLNDRPSIVIRDTELHSFLTATYTFKSSKSKVGDAYLSQFVVHSNAISSAAPIKISMITICFENNMNSITLKHADLEGTLELQADSVSLRKIVLCDKFERHQNVLTVSTSLLFRPGSSTVFEFYDFFRESGEFNALTATFYMSTELFDIQYINGIKGNSSSGIWWDEDSARKRPIRGNASSIKVLPKPPKLELHLKTQDNQYCINETIYLQLVILNDEDADVILALDVKMLGEHVPKVSWEIEPSHDSRTSAPTLSISDVVLKGIPVGTVLRGKTVNLIITIHPIEYPGKYELLMESCYCLSFEPSVPILKTVSTLLQITNPFEVTYDFSPRIHHDEWPSVFAHEEENNESDIEESRAQGIPQKWCLTARFSSLAISDLTIEDLNIETSTKIDDVQCLITKTTILSQDGVKVSPGTIQEFKFNIVTQNLSLDNRAIATLDKSLVISWRRNAINSSVNHTRLSIPSLHVSSSEPRVIAEISYDANSFSVQLNIMIENPSHHFLSFGLSMESSDKFAFSGTKLSILQLLPLSRKSVQFRILPYVRGKWLGPINCVIRDRYYQKVLKIMTTEGMMSSPEGILIWIPKSDIG